MESTIDVSGAGNAVEGKIGAVLSPWGDCRGCPVAGSCFDES